MKENYPFLLRPLPYDYTALEPYIDARTVEIHHDRHLKNYVNQLNLALENHPQYHLWSLEKLLCNCASLPKEIQTAVFNNGGGVFNHNLYFDIMDSPQKEEPHGIVVNAIQRTFGTFEQFQSRFSEAAASVFGSGWAWLVLNQFGCLQIVQTANQATPLPGCLCPLLALDVWEHAYYLQYQNERKRYIENWFHLINWAKVDDHYMNCSYC